MWPFRKRPDRPQKIDRPTIEFVCEQDGPRERELKQALVPVLSARPEVARAYLCRVRYGREEASVALALAAPEDPALVAEVGDMFSRMAPKGVHLDILFVEGGMQQQLVKVCKHFYDAGQSATGADGASHRG